MLDLSNFNSYKNKIVNDFYNINYSLALHILHTKFSINLYLFDN